MNASWAQTRLNISPSGPSRRSQNIYPVRLWSGVGIEIVRGSLPHSRAGRSVVRGKEGCASIFLRYLAESLGDSGIKIHVLVPSAKKGESTVKNSVTIHCVQTHRTTLFHQVCY